MTRFKNAARVLGAATAIVLLAPTAAWACPICFGGDPDTPIAHGVNWAVFTMLGVTGGVLSGFVGLILRLMKRSRQALGRDTEIGCSSGPEGRA